MGNPYAPGAAVQPPPAREVPVPADAEPAGSFPGERLLAAGASPRAVTAFAVFWNSIPDESRATASEEFAGLTDADLAAWVPLIEVPDGNREVLAAWVDAHEDPRFAAKLALGIEEASPRPRTSVVAYMNRRISQE